MVRLPALGKDRVHFLGSDADHVYKRFVSGCEKLKATPAENRSKEIHFKFRTPEPLELRYNFCFNPPRDYLGNLRLFSHVLVVTICDHGGIYPGWTMGQPPN